MINFSMRAPASVADAVRQIAVAPGAKFIAGGTNLVDLMKEDVERPTRLIDITRLPLKAVEQMSDGSLRDRRARAQHRPCLSSADRAALSDAVECYSGRSLAAVTQHGIYRRQPAATDALPLLL